MFAMSSRLSAGFLLASVSPARKSLTRSLITVSKSTGLLTRATIASSRHTSTLLPPFRTLSRVRIPRPRIHVQLRSYGRQPFNYQRFQQNRAYFSQWAQHPHFYYHLGAIAAVGGGFYIFNLEDVPVSHRRRFRIVSYDTEAAMGQQMFQQTVSEFGRNVLPPDHPYSQMVRRVAQRLIPHSGLQDQKWEVFVIKDDMKNAFVIPGGKIFVFSGMFDVCKDDDSLAAVIGHEIGHNVAHHAAERASSSSILMLGAWALALITGTDIGIGNLVLDLAFMKPGSRTQETEADYIGLLMMSEACYNPQAAVGMWTRMEKLGEHAPPQWLSTHPSNHNRIEKIRAWLPEAEDKRLQSGCSAIAPQASQFWSQAMALR